MALLSAALTGLVIQVRTAHAAQSRTIFSTKGLYRKGQKDLFPDDFLQFDLIIGNKIYCHILLKELDV